MNKEELIGIFLRIAQGRPLTSYIDPADGKVKVTEEKAPEGATAVSVVMPTTPEQLRAAEFLWDKIEPPTKNVDLNVKDATPRRGPDVSKMNPAQLDRYVQLHREMLALREGEPGKVIDVPSEPAAAVPDESGKK